MHKGLERKVEIKKDSLTNGWILYTLKNDAGMTVKFLNYGGIITEIITPDRNGVKENVVIGYENYTDYETNDNYFGALTGPVAGRIQGASFTFDGETYFLTANDGDNHLHGGPTGFHQVLWDGKTSETDDEVAVELSYHRPDGEGGYPGNVDVKVTYTLTNQNEFKIRYEATTDKATPLALTNHTYFNLSGNLKETVENHIVTLDSDQFVELDSHLIPTGKILDVEGTTFDFRNGRKISEGIQAPNEQNIIADNGYDHYFLFNHEREEQVVVKEETSGRVLTVRTDEKGMVMYSANMLDEGLKLLGGPSRRYLGLCLETQGSPASLHHEKFSSIILQPEENYKKETVFTFSTDLA